ncbi:monovalent cation/H+ antiporter complex subunit F [Propionicicella superfundia]|uniref:monovalent cation/H+ antiporter complex subunit F n=1 Tax=Propionicicella superfundia TaxID=348582 RepID=UPI0003F67FBE|nr:monovalent cation/H+ antiporter complex subunit F [Propionicicella superfundia]
MNVVEIVLLFIAGAMLTVAAALTLWRIVIGPTALDRIVAADVVIAIVIAAIGISIAVSGFDTGLPMMLVLSLLGFSGAVAMSRLISGSRMDSTLYQRRLEGRTPGEDDR